VEHRGRKLRLYLVGHEPGRLGGPPNIVEGRPISQSRFELVADSAAGLALGERVKLGRSTFEVVGLTRGQVSSGGDPVVYLTLRDAQKLQFELAPPAARRELARGGAGVNSDIVNAVVARVSDNVPLGSLADSVKRWKHLSALTHDEQETILTRSVIERARRQIGLFTSILLLVSTVIIALIIYTLTIDKMREIATLKLIGAPDRTIIGLIVQQALAMGVVGFLFATAFVHAIRPYFPRRVELLADDAGALAAVLLLICLVASGLGVRLALKVDPAAALGG
jgi:putative ABC transport system permease protein